MKKGGFKSVFFFVVACVILLSAGCEQPADEVVLRQPEPVFEPQQSPVEEPQESAVSQPGQDSQRGRVTYKVITEAQQTLKYEGSLADNERFKGGRNANRIEMIFTQDNQSANDRGNIVAKVTINELKVTTVMRDEKIFDFDSSREKDMSRPIAGLIGQDYKVELLPGGRFVSVIDAGEARAAVAGRTDDNKRALALLRDSAIEQRHSVPDIRADEVLAAAVGDSWSSIKIFEFPILGEKSYERVYTLTEVKQLNGINLAVIDMKSLPSAESTEDTIGGPLMDMFDNRRTYTGRLKLDLDAKMLKSYYEKLDSEWLFVDPETDPNSDKAPASFRMGAIRSYSIEKIN